jgi:integrase
MTGTELKIITPAATEVLGPEVDRLATLHTNARTDTELLKVWLKSHQDGSAHTIRVYKRVGERFSGALAAAGSDLRRATVEDVQAALGAMRTKQDSSPVRPATVNTYVATVKSFLGFAHRVGYTQYNAAPLIKLKKAPSQVAQRIMGELDVRMLIRATRPGRDKLMLETAYFGGLRVSELVSLIWAQVIRRDNGEAQLEVVGKGDKVRQVLIPAEISARLLARRGDAPASGPCIRLGPATRRASHGARCQLHGQGRCQACRRQPRRLRALASPCSRQPCNRQWRADHTCVGNPWPRRLSRRPRSMPTPVLARARGAILRRNEWRTGASDPECRSEVASAPPSPFWGRVANASWNVGVHCKRESARFLSANGHSTDPTLYDLEPSRYRDVAC